MTFAPAKVPSHAAENSCESRRRSAGAPRRRGSSLADLQQFFTGKLYVLMQQLKLPAEELLWSSLFSSEMASDTPLEEEEEDEESRAPASTLLLVWRDHVLPFLP